MSYSFEAIEQQAKETRSRASQILGEKDSLLKNKKAIAVLSLSAVMVAASFIAPNLGSFSANLLEESEFTSSEVIAEAQEVEIQTEAEEITIDPVSARGPSADALLAEDEGEEEKTEVAAATDVVITQNPFLTNTVATTKEVAAAPVEVNPFLSLEKQEEVQEVKNTVAKVPTRTETLHGSAPAKKPVAKAPEAVKMTVTTPTTTTTKAVTPFKENKHTFDTVSDTPLYAGMLQDPIADILATTTEEVESMHGTTEIVDMAQEVAVTAQAENRYTGIVTNTWQRSDRPFSYYLTLEDGDQLLINTQRDLRNIDGKEITIEIEGDKESFVLKKVFFKPQATLAESGPAETMGLLALLAVMGAWVMRRKQS